MYDKFPSFVNYIMETLTLNKFDSYVVGGAIRDLLMERVVKDWDFTTNATPDEILLLFKSSFYDNVFGTVGIPNKGYVYEITTYRTEQGYTDSRHPDKVKWGKTLEEDLQRRDFTINAMAMDSNGNIIDPYKGQSDLQNKIIKAVGNPEERFNEDALRLMRAVRIATQLGFTIDTQTFEAIKNNALKINLISAERIRDELLKILSSNHPADGFTLLLTSGVLENIIPELTKGKGVSQSHHHKYDVWTHSLYSMKECPSTDPLVRFATLIHDVGKPAVKKGEGQEATFYNHEVVGESTARNIMQRLKFPNKAIERVTNLIRWHMFTVDEHITDAAVRRFIRRVGKENIKDMIDLRIGDRLGGGCLEATSWRLRKFMKRIIEVQKTPLSVKDLKVDGNDVMKVLKIHPSPKVGQILNALFEEVLEDASKNNKECLLKRIKEINS